MRKLALLAAATMVVVGMGTAQSFANGNSWFIDPESGTDSATCGGPSLVNAQPSIIAATSGPCQSLNQALQNGSAGDTFTIEKDGIFGPIYLTGTVSISGPEDRGVVIEWLNTPPGCLGGAPGSCSEGNALYGVDVEAPASANASIRLKNLIINNAAGGAANGAIHFGSGFNLSLASVTVRGGGSTTLSQMMLVNPSALGTNGQVQLYMKNCDVGFSSSGGGVLVQPSGATPIYVHILDTEVHNAKFGVKFDSSLLSSGSGIQAEFDSSELSAFNGSALATIGTGSGTAHVAFSRSAVLDAGQYAVQVNGTNASVVLFEDVILGNAVGVNSLSGGGAASMGNNMIFANGNNCESNNTPTNCTGAGGVLFPESLQ
jgi:hypothetical protein